MAFNINRADTMIHPATFDRCLTYLETQVGPQRKAGQKKPPTVTISRLTGSGGIPIAERLAAYLQKHRPGAAAPWTVFHRTLVERALAEHKLPASLAEYMPEDRVSYIQDVMEELLGLHPSRTSLVAQVTETILGLAELGNCIIIGRGANIILAKSPTVLHVRLISSLERRVERVAKDKQISPEQAREFIQREDAARLRYLKSHFQADLEDPLGYHLVLNTDWFSADEAAELIGQAVIRHFPE
jgi:cytidylate kinase